MYRIAVLLTCYNRKNKTLQCLKNLYNQKSLSINFLIDTYLVDDESSDGTGKAVQQNFPQVKVIQGNGNLYWNRGMFTAWKFAAVNKYDFFLWLNDDTNLYVNCLNEMLSAAIKTKYKAIICGCIESPLEKGRITYGGGQLNGFRYKLNYPRGVLKECDLIHGNCLLIPHFAYKIVGNLDWRFVHAIGDHDYGLRARKLGVKIYTTGKFVASCAKHEVLPKWCLPKTKFIERIRHLYSPLGYSHPYYFYIYERRHFGLFVALKHYVSIHLRVLIPRLWTYKKI